MVKILKTNTGYYVAFKDDVTLTADEIRSCKSASYNNPKVHERFQFKEAFPKADAALTKALMTEMTRHVSASQKAVNELSDDRSFRKHILETEKKTGRHPLCVHYTINTSDLPSDYAENPISLLRNEEFYFPKYDGKKQCYICCDETGRQISINSNRASFDFKKTEITIQDKVFFFTPQEAETIKKIQTLSQKHRLNDILAAQSPQIKALYSFYLDIKQHYLDKKQKLYSVSHELQHAQTQQRINKRRQKLNYAELSPANMYRFDEDNEKAAHLKETYLAIAKFFQHGGDISVFPEKCQWLVNKIKNLSFEKQKQVLLNNNYIVNGNIENWNKNYAKHYIEQRFTIARDHAYDAPVLRMENGDKEYLACRSCAYTMDVYNPQTGKTERQDLSRYIQIPTIIREEEQDKVQLCETIRKQRLQTLTQNGIDLKLILSLFNETYQEPFKQPSPQLLEEQILRQGISFKSRNNNGDTVLIKVKKKSLPDRPNCLIISSSLNEKPVFYFVLNKDKNEYICHHFGNCKKYSNATNSQYTPLPETALKQIKKYINEASNIITLMIKQKYQGIGSKE